jgi:hypothetical protein
MAYVPKHGSVPARVIHFLEGHDSVCVSRRELSRHLGCEPRTIEPNIAAAIKAGVIHRARSLEDGQVYYSLSPTRLPIGERGEPVLESEAVEQPVVSGAESGTPFEFCLWHDGDLDIFGLEVLERADGRQHVRLTREQLESIVSVLFGMQMTPFAR